MMKASIDEKRPAKIYKNQEESLDDVNKYL